MVCGAERVLAGSYEGVVAVEEVSASTVIVDESDGWGE